MPLMTASVVWPNRLTEATNRIIACARERYDKQLTAVRTGGERPALVLCEDEHEQSTFVVERILEHRERGVPLASQAVLFRAAHHAADLELECARRNVPFVKYGGLRFLEMAHIKDLLAVVRLAENPFDGVAALRVLQLVPGIGPRTAQALTERLAHADGDFDAWVTWEPPEGSRETWRSLVTLLRSLRHGDPTAVAAQVGAARAFLAPIIEQRYDHAAARIADLEQLEAIASRFRDRARFAAELACDPPQWTSELAAEPLLDEDHLVLSTMHSAKGLEFTCVYVIHAADGMIPSDMATSSADEIEEERRLFYVACTRARDHLYVTYPLRYYVAGRGATDRHGYAQRTRFITDDVRVCFAETTASAASGEPDEPVDVRTDDVGIAARARASVRARWA